MIKVVILFQQLVFILISGIGIARSLLGVSQFLTLKELGRKLKHSLLGSGLMECSPIFFFAKMTQIIFLVQRFGARKELDPSHLVE